MEKETGAKIEASMCMRRGIRSDKHLWKQTPASRSRGGMRRDMEHKCEEMHCQRDTYAKMHAPGDTGKDQNQAGTSVGGQTPPSHSGTPRKPKATSVLSPKQLHLWQRQGQDSSKPPPQTCKLLFSGPSCTPPPSSQAVRGA